MFLESSYLWLHLALDDRCNESCLMNLSGERVDVRNKGEVVDAEAELVTSNVIR